MLKKLKSLAVVVPTITSRKNEFKRCMDSLKMAEKFADKSLEIRYFTSLDTSREQLLKENIEEISKCDLVTFVDDDDYVSRSFFVLPPSYREDEIYQIKSLTLKVKKFDHFYFSRKGGIVYPALYAGENIKAFNEIKGLDGGYRLEDCHLWGYFYPSVIIKELTKELLIPNPEVTGPWEDTCYWAWIVTKYGNILRWINSPIYFHMALNKTSLVHKLTKEDKAKKIEIIKSINENLDIRNLGLSGCEHVRFLHVYGPYHDSLKEFIDLFELREHKLTRKERSKFRKMTKFEAWNDCVDEEFLGLINIH